MNEIIKDLLVELLDEVYLYVAKTNANPPYVVYGVDGANDLEAGNVHSEKADEGTIDLYTKDPTDSLITDIPEGLDENGVSYYLNSVQFEEETGLLHYEWVWQI